MTRTDPAGDQATAPATGSAGRFGPPAQAAARRRERRRLDRDGRRGKRPAYSIAATTATLVGTAALGAPGALLWSAIPMMGIAWAFLYLGRADVNAGASYSWVARALHPMLGFLSGWALVISATIFMVAGALPAGAMTVTLFSPKDADNVPLITGGRRALVPRDGRLRAVRRARHRPRAVDHVGHRGRHPGGLRRAR